MKARKGIIFLSFMTAVLFISQLSSGTYAENNELTYRFKEGDPTTALNWQLTFPTECHPGDSVNCSIFLNLETSMHTKFYLVIEAAVGQQWVTQYNETLLAEGNYSAGQEFHWQIPILTPENAHGNLRLFAQTLHSYWGWLYVTNVRSTTYNELEQFNIQLDESLNELNQSYTALDDEHNSLISTYEPFGKLANTRNLLFIFMALTFFFAATSGYVLMRRRRT